MVPRAFAPAAPALLGPWLLALLPGCFSEPEPIDDGTSTCAQPCSTGSTTDAPTTGPASATGPLDASTSSDPVDSTGTTGSDGPEPPDGTTGVAAICGDGQVNQPSEMCDSTPGCRDDCRFESYACNPLNDAGCTNGERCGAIDVPVESFGCMPPGPGGLGVACSGVPANDSDCDVGLTCLFSFNTPLCGDGNCCVEYCDLTDPTFRCSGGASCLPFFPAPMYQGLEHLGYCGY